MSELPGLVHMEGHIPPRLRPFLHELMTGKPTREVARKIGLVGYGAGYYRRLSIIKGCLGLDGEEGLGAGPTEAFTRLRLLRQACGLDRCWCDCE